MTLAEYLAKKKIKPPEFAVQIGMSRTVVIRYVSGDRMPSGKVMARIEQATGGKVRLADWLAQAEASRTEQAA